MPSKFQYNMLAQEVALCSELPATEVNNSCRGRISKAIRKRTTWTALLVSLAMHAGAVTAPKFVSGAISIVNNFRYPGLEDLTEEEREAVMKLHEKDKQIIEKRSKERAKRIDPEKVKAHKAEIRRKILAGEKIPYYQFFKEVEEIAMGVDPKIIQEGEKYLNSKIDKFRAKKHSTPDLQLIEKLAHSLMNLDEEGKDEYDMTSTSLFAYLAAKADLNQKKSIGSCAASSNSVLVGIERLFPQYHENIYIQTLLHHQRPVIEIQGEMYAIEWGELVKLTDENKAGTYIYSPYRLMKIYAGLEDQIEDADELLQEGEYKKQKLLPTVTDGILDDKLPASLASRDEEEYEDTKESLRSLFPDLDKTIAEMRTGKIATPQDVIEFDVIQLEESVDEIEVPKGTDKNEGASNSDAKEVNNVLYRYIGMGINYTDNSVILSKLTQFKSCINMMETDDCQDNFEPLISMDISGSHDMAFGSFSAQFRDRAKVYIMALQPCDPIRKLIINGQNITTLLQKNGKTYTTEHKEHKASVNFTFQKADCTSVGPAYIAFSSEQYVQLFTKR